MLARVMQYLLPCMVLFSGILIAAPTAGLNDQAIARTAPIVRSLMSKEVPDDPHQLAVVTAELELLGLKADAATLKDYSERRTMDIAMGGAQPQPSLTIQAALASERQSSMSLDDAKQHFASTAFPVDFTRTAVSDEEIQRAKILHRTRELDGLWVAQEMRDETNDASPSRTPPFRFVAAVVSNNTQFGGEIHLQMDLAPGVRAVCDAHDIEAHGTAPTVCQIFYPRGSADHVHELMSALKAGSVHATTSQMLFLFAEHKYRLLLGTQYARSDEGLDAEVDAKNLVRAASCEDLDNCGKQRRATLASPQLWHLGILALFMGLTMVVRFHSVARHRASGWPKGIWLAYAVVAGLVGVLSVMDPVTGHGYDGMVSTWAQVLAGMPWTAVSLDAYSSAQAGLIGYHAPAPPSPWIFMVVNFFYLSFMTFYRSADVGPLTSTPPNFE